MARTALLALVFLAGIAACSATPAIRWLRFSSGGVDPEPSCLSYTDEDSCLAHACGWCSSDLLGDLGCLTEGLAKLVPQAIAECKVNEEPSGGDDDDDDDDNDDDVEVFLLADGGGEDPEPKPKKPTSCGDIDKKGTCLEDGAEEGQCAWCKGDFMPPSCVGIDAAKWIPETVAKCKMPKQHKQEDGEVTLQKKGKGKKDKKEATCSDIKEKRQCVKDGAEEGECAWCEGKFMPASCMTAMAAKYLPETVAKCKLPKPDKDEQLAGVNKQKGKGGSGYGPSGGDWPSGSGDWPSGGGDYPGPGGGGQGQGCMALKSKKKCLKGTDTEACAWCGKSSFLGSPCVSESTAKYIPSFMSKCKMGGKGKKKGDRSDDVAGDDDIYVATA